ncbi:SPOR domain-containing protein [Paracoccus marinaquae]|uniref:SPOR domain-containing protein n=1 Tax=Paracoccus marinaquae TaxID=2841926 RepID=A0ABS6AIQ7_9RHOB|nr:SPOR domain-containing protein [Paracoccus marinaquae]
MFWAALGVLSVAAVAGHAGPVPPPPEDYGSTQYVDGNGCVYRHEDGAWVGLVDATGAAVCGFPPTVSLRAATTGAEFPRDPADLLAETLAAGLRQGEYLGDPRPVETKTSPDLAAPADPISEELAALARNEAALRSALIGGGGGSDLCRLLGYRPDPEPRPVLGQDVTRGLCPGMRAPLPEERISAAEAAMPATAPAPAAVLQPAASAEARVTRPQTRPVTAKQGADTGKAAMSLAKAPSLVRRGPTDPAPEDPSVEMIPASARFVQVGAFADDANATIVIRRLSEMGYRVGQTRSRHDGKPVRVILAGPFTDRRSLVAALNRLRAQGYPGAVAR